MDDPAAPKAKTPSHRVAAMAIVVLALAFALHAYLAARTKTPTFDEPPHALASWLIVNEGDFRLSPEHPPLWRYIAGLPLIGQPLDAGLFDTDAKALFKDNPVQWHWAARILFQTPGNDGLALIGRSRAIMVVFPFLLALVVGRWAWVWSGPPAGVLAVALLSLEPTLLAHGGLVTNDVAATLIFTLGAYLTWRIGERFTVGTAIALALTCAAGIGTKMSCLLLGPMVGVPLLIRALDSEAWRVGAGTVRTRLARLSIIVGYGLSVVVLAGILLWPLYLFRYEPTRNADSFNDKRQRWYQGMFSAEEKLGMRYDASNRQLLLDEAAKFKPGLIDRTVYSLSDHHLLPHSWGFGYAYVRANSLNRPSFLMGEFSDRGFVSYFPIAIACKTPIVTLGLSIFTVGIALLRRRLLFVNAPMRWKCVCLVVPSLIYLATAMAGNLNIGVRHVLPVYPAIYLGGALAIVSVTRSLAPRARNATRAAIVLALAVETTSAFPNYISFFNAAVGGPRAGLEILGDSNLDWGQDLNALAEWYKPWRAANPDRPFFLSYYGTVDPHLYGIDYLNAVPGYAFGPEARVTDMTGGVYAISASSLQGLSSLDADSRHRLAQLRNTRPIAILNDTFYIYDFGPAPSTRPATTMPAQP